MAIMKGAKCDRRCIILKIVEAPGGAEGGRPNASFVENQGKLQRSCDVRVICDVFNDVSRFPTIF